MPWKLSGHMCTLSESVKEQVHLQVHKEMVDAKDQLTGLLLLHDCHNLVLAKLNPRYRTNQLQGLYKENTVLDVIKTSGQPRCLVLVSLLLTD